MPSQQETQQPQSIQMVAPQPMEAGINTEQPRPTEQMTAEPVRMRGGGDVCCGM
ncbi:hypothetical protein LARI1_G003809 [Lachnellula arida]|uniref:Uncharacterized protein n=2 Tax=Lachnellula TaxID=47830 RepID=A0A8T9B7P0_9HELO|nr:hypothetical protein LARI1_G003809 [Lachnellula arida]